MKRLLLFSLYIFYFTCAFSQTGTNTGPTPAQTLRLARATYEQGRLHEIPQQLNDDVISKMTKQEKVSAYGILCLAYIYLEESQMADESMLKILQTDSYFQINPAIDPAEFVALYNTFRTQPIYRIGAKIGVNASRPNVVENVTAVELGADSGYKYLIGFQFGATADLPLYMLVKNSTLHADLLFQQKQYQIDLKVNRGVSSSGESLINRYQGVEKQTWLSLPVIFEYRVLEKKFNPFIGLGASIDYLLGAEITSQRSRENETSIEEKTYDFKPQREKINISAVASAGVKMRMAGGYFVAEARFLYGLSKVNSNETAFKNAQYTLEQGYADPTFKLTSIEVTAGYIQNIFKPKKLIRKK